MICKETGKCDSYTGKKEQAILSAFEGNPNTDLTDKNYKAAFINMFKI